MPLEVGNLRAGQKYILPRPCTRLFLPDLEFHDVGGVLDDFGDVGNVARSDLTEDALVDPDETADKPVALV